MNEPQEPLAPLDQDLRALLSRAESGAPPIPAGMEDQVLAKVSATSALGALKLGTSKLALAALGVAALTATLLALRPSSPAVASVAPVEIAAVAPVETVSAHTETAPVVAPAAPVVAPAPVETAPVVAHTETAPVAPVVAPVVVETAPAAPVETGPSEDTLLERARASLAQGDGKAALVALQDHQRRFPHGALVEERRALTVVAFARSGDHARAQSAARAFLREYPTSLFVDTVRAASE